MLDFFERLKRRAERYEIVLGTYKEQYYLQKFDDTQPMLFAADLNHIDFFLDGYIKGSQMIESDEQNLLVILNKVDSIYQSEADWEYKYDRIFGMSKEISSLLKSLNLTLEYYDPDTTYEEDVRAYVNALGEVRKNLESHLL